MASKYDITYNAPLKHKMQRSRNTSFSDVNFFGRILALKIFWIGHGIVSLASLHELGAKNSGARRNMECDVFHWSGRSAALQSISGLNREMDEQIKVNMVTE